LRPKVTNLTIAFFFLILNIFNLEPYFYWGLKQLPNLLKHWAGIGRIAILGCGIIALTPIQNFIVYCPQKVSQSVGTMPNKAEVTSSNPHPPSRVEMSKNIYIVFLVVVDLLFCPPQKLQKKGKNIYWSSGNFLFFLVLRRYYFLKKQKTIEFISHLNFKK
jgi:hypothetical protein